MNWDYHDELLQAAFAGAVGAFFRAFKKNNSFVKSFCFSAVGFLCSVYLTTPIEQHYPFLNEDGLAFLVGLFGCELSEKAIDYLSNKFLKSEKDSN